MFFKTVYTVARHLVRRLLRFADRDALIQELLAEIIVLRKENAILARTNPRPKLRPQDRILLAALSGLLPRCRWGAFSFSPKTLLRWHRELVAAKWTFKHKTMGRPAMDPELRDLIISMAKNSSDWGCYRVKGELQGLGIKVGVTTIRRILRRAGVPPAPRRDGPTWSEFLRSQADVILACDFFCVDTVFLRTLYVLVFIEIGSRRLRFSVSTEHPGGVFCTQQARNLYVEEDLPNVAFLIRDRDSKYIRSFDDVFRAQGVTVIKTPIQAPNAKGVASHCTSWGRFGRYSARQPTTHAFDESRVPGRGRLVEPLVLVVGLVGQEQPGGMPGLDRARVYPEPSGNLAEAQHAGAAEPIRVTGQLVRAA